MLRTKGRPLAKSASRSSEWKARSCHSSSCCGLGRCKEDRHIRPVGAPGGAERVDSPALTSHGHIARCPLRTPHAAQRQRALLCEGAPLSREAVAQQDEGAGSPALSARQEVTEVEAPVYFAPRQAQQGAQEDRVLPQVAAVQVCDGLKGVDTTHLQGRTPDGEVVFQLSRAEEGRVKHSDVPQQPVHMWGQPRFPSHVLPLHAGL